MRVNSYAKINWALKVEGVRDGYHMLDGVMENINLYDIININVTKSGTDCITYSNVRNMKGDLCKKACDAFRKALGIKFGTQIYVRKNIPSRAGLGGGSSNCACVLNFLNRYFKSPLNRRELLSLGASLGADVPFFLVGGACRAQGKGEVLKKLNRLRMTNIVLAKPIGRGVSTREAFAICDAEKNKQDIHIQKLIWSLENNNIRKIAQNMHNHLENASIQIMPDIKDIIDRFYENGALKAVMTGSGSCVVALFDVLSPDIQGMEKYWVYKTHTVMTSWK